MAKVIVTISTYVGFVAGASHYWATIHEYEGETFQEGFNTKAQAKQYAREIVEEHYKGHEVENEEGKNPPWMYTREGD